MASISIVLYTSKILKNGESPLMLRIIKDRKIKYINLAHSTTPNLWDFAKQLPKKKHPQETELTILIEKKVSDARKLVLELENSVGDFSLDEFVQRYKRQNKRITVLTYIDHLVNGYVELGKIGNSEVYKSLKWVLKRFRNEKDFSFTDVDQAFLSKLEQDLRQRGIKETSMSNYFRTFRSVYSKAVKDGYTSEEKDPFKDFKISRFKTKTKKRALSKETIKLIEAVDLTGKPKLEFARDIFLFSYYTWGINIIDIARLDESNIDSGLLIYVRSKTKQPINCVLSANSLNLIAKYKALRPGNYLFPILDKNVHVNEVMIKNRVKKVTKQVNEGLKEIAPLVKIEPEALSTLAARHSFATALKRGNMQIEKISEAMGHDSVKTTMIYLDSFDKKELSDEISNLL